MGKGKDRNLMDDGLFGLSGLFSHCRPRDMEICFFTKQLAIIHSY